MMASVARLPRRRQERRRNPVVDLVARDGVSHCSRPLGGPSQHCQVLVALKEPEKTLVRVPQRGRAQEAQAGKHS